MDQLETLLTEIYDLEPALKERDGDVRALVSLLIKNHPKVEVDPAFVTSLRTRILNKEETKKTPVSSPYGVSMGWWVTRLVPLGAVAVLLFMLVEYGGKPVPLVPPQGGGESINQEAPSRDTMRMVTPEHNEKSVGESAPSVETMDASDTSLFSTEPMMPEMGMKKASNPIEILPQGANVKRLQVILTAPVSGFVGVYAGDASEAPMLGVSTFVSSGTGEVTVELSRPLIEGEVVSVRFLADSGDRIFNARMDRTYVDTETGMPYVVFYTVPGEFINN